MLASVTCSPLMEGSWKPPTGEPIAWPISAAGMEHLRFRNDPSGRLFNGQYSRLINGFLLTKTSLENGPSQLRCYFGPQKAEHPKSLRKNSVTFPYQVA